MSSDEAISRGLVVVGPGPAAAKDRHDGLHSLVNGGGSGVQSPLDSIPVTPR